MGLIIVCAAVGLQAQQVLPSEVAAIETAWASGQRLTNTPVSITRGFAVPGNPAAAPAAPSESISTDATGIARTSTKSWERIVIHLPRVVAANHIACLMVNSKCQALPVGARLDKANSILYWHVPSPYKGDFDLVFLQPGSRAGAIRVTTGIDKAALKK
jgi:hypothetical protein